TITASPRIYTLSLHDALPISISGPVPPPFGRIVGPLGPGIGEPIDPTSNRIPNDLAPMGGTRRALPIGARSFGIRLDDGSIGSPDRKSTRLNSSHVAISYAVF